MCPFLLSIFLEKSPVSLHRLGFYACRRLLRGMNFIPYINAVIQRHTSVARSYVLILFDLLV